MAQPQQRRGFDALIEQHTFITADITVKTVGMRSRMNKDEVGREHPMEMVASFQ